MSTRIDGVAGRCVGGPAGQIGLVRLQEWTLAHYGGQSLGVYSCRTVRGGKGMSVHSEGRAFDWRAPNRAVLNGYFQTLVQHADALGIQAIHDYDNKSRWTGKTGWKKASIGAAPFKAETHVERNWDGARDGRPIGDIVRTGAPPPSPEIPQTTVPPMTAMEDDDVLLESELKKSTDPNRPALAELRRIDRCIILYNNAALGGDQQVFAVRVRYLPEIPPNIAVAGWRAVPGGVQVLDAVGAAYGYVWT